MLASALARLDDSDESCTFSVPAETVVPGFAGLRGRASAAVEGAIALPELSIFMAQFPYRVALTFSSARSRET